MVMESAHKIVNWLHEWHHHRLDEEVNAEQFKSGSTQKSQFPVQQRRDRIFVFYYYFKGGVTICL